MELKESVKEQFEDGKTFLNYIKYHIFDDNDDSYETNINDIDFLEGHKLVKDHPKVIKLKEIFEPKMLMSMKRYFYERPSIDFTKRSVRSYISDYNKMCRKRVVPFNYFFRDEELNNLYFEWFENDLGELLFQKRVRDGNSTFPFGYLDIFDCFTDEFVEEMLSSDIKTITKKLIQTL